jgi:predicted lipoprotein with Yx(FWY)xxD motif
MRSVALALIAFLLLALGVSVALAGEEAPAKTEHPANVALVHYENSWKYVHFPSSLSLYVFDRDSTGKSACNLGCDGAWPPLMVTNNDKAVGDWSIIDRYDGSRQWAYKGHPVYLHYHDSPDQPLGNGVDGAWHFLEP